MLTPLEIENKKFSKKIKGYDPEEVDEFLDEIIEDYEILYRKNNETQGKIEDLEKELEHYKEIESTLQKTLFMAQSTTDDMKLAAKKEAENILKEAENQRRELTFGIEQEISDKKRELLEVKKQFENFKSKMEYNLISQLELLKNLEKED